MSDARLIQVPWYLGREHPDLSRGPGVLAEAIGGETVGVPGPEPRPVPNEVADSFDVIRSVRAAVSEAVADGRFPLVLAVNCFTSLGTVTGVGRDLGVIWFDAHGDFHTPDSTPTGFLDGMGFAMLTGSRLGAAFVVLLVAVIYALRGGEGERMKPVSTACAAHTPAKQSAWSSSRTEPDFSPWRSPPTRSSLPIRCWTWWPYSCAIT